MARAIANLCLALLLAIGLAEIYQRLPGNQDLLFKILLFHSALALVVLWRGMRASTMAPVAQKIGPFSSEWLPSLILALGLGIALALSSVLGQATGGEFQYNPLWIIVWAPIVEELVFRRGFGSFFRAKMERPWLGAYISALFFALVHTQPTLERLQTGEIGIPLGPFLLGLVCEFIYAQRGRIIPCIVFHGMANLSGYLFAEYDQRWLHWLRALYI